MPVFGEDLVPSAVERPQVVDGRLLLPPPVRLRALDAVALKPLRLWLAVRCGCRLQAPPGVGLWRWSDRALLVSELEVPAAGFLHGPERGTRAPLALAPGGWQEVRFG